MTKQVDSVTSWKRRACLARMNLLSKLQIHVLQRQCILFFHQWKWSRRDLWHQHTASSRTGFKGGRALGIDHHLKRTKLKSAVVKLWLDTSLGARTDRTGDPFGKSWFGPYGAPMRNSLESEEQYAAAPQFFASTWFSLVERFEYGQGWSCKCSLWIFFKTCKAVQRFLSPVHHRESCKFPHVGNTFFQRTCFEISFPCHWCVWMWFRAQESNRNSGKF